MRTVQLIGTAVGQGMFGAALSMLEVVGALMLLNVIGGRMRPRTTRRIAFHSIDKDRG
jgi:hypothetical protein